MRNEWFDGKGVGGMDQELDRGALVVSTRSGLTGGKMDRLGRALWGRKPYCDVYEGGLVGIASWAGEENTRDFELSYGEIVNVTEGGQSLFLYTRDTLYVVAAQVNLRRAVEEILRRIHR